MAINLPPLAPGTVLRLAPDDWRYHGAQDGHLVLRFTRYWRDISRYYDDQVWVEATRLDEHGQPVGAFQALVRVEALRIAAEAPPDSALGTVLCSSAAAPPRAPRHPRNL